MSTPTGWARILDKDEKILWQGRPDGAVTLGVSNLLVAAFGLFFAGFALFWMVMAARAGGGFWAFGLLHFSVGAGLVFGAVFWGAYRRRHCWYTLTSRRAFIATDLPLRGKRLKSYPITPETTLELVDGPLATVNFASDIVGDDGASRRDSRGFERIPDGQEVFRLMRDVQANVAAVRQLERTQKP